MLTYNGVDLSNLIGVTEISGRGPMSQEINRFSIPGRPGSYFQNRRKPERIIGVSIEITGNSLSDIRSKVDDLNAILDVDVPSSIVFSDEANMIYYGILDGEPDWSEIVFIGKGTLNFVCLDPYKYGQTLNGVFVNDNRTVVNDGTAETYPIFKGQVINPITYLDIVSEQGYMRIGEPVSVEETPFIKEEIILSDSMSSLTGWGEPLMWIMAMLLGIDSDGQGFYPSSFGTVIDPPMWQGPAMKKSLSQSLQDFRLEALVELKNLTGQTGMIEIYLLDAANNVVGKIGIEDRSGRYETFAKARAGDINGKWIAAAETANVSKWWQDYSGIIRIERIGNLWTAYFSTIKDENILIPVVQTAVYIF